MQGKEEVENQRLSGKRRGVGKSPGIDQSHMPRLLLLFAVAAVFTGNGGMTRGEKGTRSYDSRLTSAEKKKRRQSTWMVMDQGSLALV